MGQGQHHTSVTKCTHFWVVCRRLKVQVGMLNSGFFCDNRISFEKIRFHFFPNFVLQLQLLFWSCGDRRDTSMLVSHIMENQVYGHAAMSARAVAR